MSDPYVGEIQAFPFPFATGGFNNAWLPCSGQLLAIQAFTPLFSLIGTYYGGNGTTNFQLPNLNGSVAISQGQGRGLSLRTIGEIVGSEWVTLSQPEMPAHTHGLQLGYRSATGATANPGKLSNMAAIDPTMNGFVAPPSNTMFAGTAIGPTGLSQPHANIQPTQAIVWCIAYVGIFPSFGES